MTGRRVGGATVWVMGLALAAVALHSAGGGALAPPALTEPGQWAGWIEARDPIVAAFSLLRLLAIGCLWYVVTVTLVGVALRMVGATSLVRVTDRLTIGPLRRMLAGSVSLGLAASGVVAVAGPALRAPVLAQTATTSLPTSTLPPTSAVTPATVTMHRLGPSDLPPPPATAPAPQVVPVTAASAERWTVKSGECFWSIAERVLAERWDRAPRDAEIVPFWISLIDANRDRLLHRENPDLIAPGQVFTVPAP